MRQKYELIILIWHFYVGKAMESLLSKAEERAGPESGFLQSQGCSAFQVE